MRLPETIVQNATGERITFLGTMGDERGEYLEFEVELPAGGEGPPPHVHLRQDEEFIVTSGSLRLTVDGREKRLGPGEGATVPAGAVHTWKSGEGEALRGVGRIRPPGRFRELLTETFEALNRSPEGELSLFEAARILHPYRDEYRFAPVPALVQRLLFPPTITLGRLLGRYDETA